MLKKYNSKKSHGYDKLVFYDNDIIKKYCINNKRHGYYYYWCGSEKTIWCQGLYYNDEENSHWKELYIELKYYL